MQERLSLETGRKLDVILMDAVELHTSLWDLAEGPRVFVVLACVARAPLSYLVKILDQQLRFK